MDEIFKRFEKTMNSLQKTMDNLLEDFGRPRQVRLSESEIIPSGFRKPYIDIIEKENEIIAKLEMPGLTKEDIQINLTNNRLEVFSDIKEKEEKEEKEESGEECIYSERRQEKYYRSVLLPSEIDSDASKAEYKNGVLEIRMPKIEITKKRSINIE